MSLRTTMVLGAFAAAVAAISCGSSSKKRVNPTGDAGEAGAAGAEPGENGGTAGVGPVAPEAGAAGSEEAGTGGLAGAGGEPPIEVAPLQVLFTVAPGAKGLAPLGTDNPASVIFGATSPNPNPINGNNRIVITAQQLGIADEDVIDGFSSLQVQPGADDTVYLFSVPTNVDVGASVRPVRLYYSAEQGEAGADIYASDAVQSRRWLGEGSTNWGYNALVADEQSLGLAPAFPDVSADAPRDDLTGLQPLTEGVVPSTIYFTLNANSTGLPGSAIAATAVSDRGCTVYKSELDGTNTVAFTCAELGLGADSELRGLTVFERDGGFRVWFTVSALSVGTLQTAVDEAGTTKANNVYSSDINGGNSLQVTGPQLGLATTDEIDALNVQRNLAPVYGTATNCQLNPSPDTALSQEGANLSSVSGAHGLGNHLILLTGPAPVVGEAAPRDAVGAYDVRTCEFVGRAELEPGALHDRAWVPVPLAGWTETAPLQAVEYWRLDDGDGNEPTLSRLDSAGVVVNTYALGDVSSPDGSYSPTLLEYDAANQRLFGVLQPRFGIGDYERILFDVAPSGTPSSTLVPTKRTKIPHPCAYSPEFGGVDAAGNSYFAQADFNGYGAYRVCPLTSTGEFATLPFGMVTDSSRNPTYGMIVPGDSIYGLHFFFGNSQYVIERMALTKP